MGSLVGRVYAYLHSHDVCDKIDGKNDDITYDISGANDKFSINSSGWIVLQINLTTSATGTDEISVKASCRTIRNDVISATTKVTVKYQQNDNYQITTDNSAVTDTKIVPKETIEHICFSHIANDSTFVVEENVKDIVMGRLNTCLDDQAYARTYTVEKPKSRFHIDNITSELTLIKALDREISGVDKGHPNTTNGIQPLRITCQVKINDVIHESDIYRLNITVLDVNDNPPVFIYHKFSQHIVKNIEIEPDSQDQTVQEIKEVIYDEDFVTNNTTHVIKKVEDPLDLCTPDLHCHYLRNGSLCGFRIRFPNLDNLVDPLYKCEIAVVDTGFIQQEDKSKNNSATIIVNIRKRAESAPTAMSLTSTQTVIFYRNASRLARLLQLEHDQASPGLFTLRDPVFNVTPKTGIIYVHNINALGLADDDYHLTVLQKRGPERNIMVKMFGARKESCSRHDSTSRCTGSCGLGVMGDGCVMRGSEKNTKMDRTYGTCTYDTATCPDLICDELEIKYPLLCPQDCISKANMNGAYLGNNNGYGIAMAQSPCWCEYDIYEITCNCMKGSSEEVYFSSTSRTSVDEVIMAGMTSSRIPIETTAGNETDILDMEALITEEPRVCNNACGVAIGVGLTIFFLVAFTLFMLWFTKKKDNRRKTNMKHVGSVVSLSGLPSDYQDDRERRTSNSSDSWSPKGPLIYSTQIQTMHQDDNGRWEIPRDSLHLEKTLGEGEFGLVVKARLAQTDGDVKFKNVAVKMLKHCSTQLEEQDLWSEYNLLKDVSHPNVIRLLGACTTDGPFYLVVEYCEHGCLLKYLRRSRLEENGYVNSGIRFKSPNVKEQTDPELNGDLLSMRDLLSFAWQIAKGMCYLSEIKLVHRDLAARNILVASGKVLKVSDFGLTRDVYEADTYLKKSKGRIPVKWLAPESLYAQIYTTRSDIWSYGIVLWEIVTLGAPPYPGIPPERLYNLLIGGYRMDRPENCPDEMYAVMQKCWKVDAADRPSFATLASIFDRILQEKTGYLDLSRTNMNVSVLYNKCFPSQNHDKGQLGEPSTDRDAVISIPETAEENVEMNLKIGTVCNETYCTDNYLEPTPSKFQKEMNNGPNVSQLVESFETGNRDNRGSTDEYRPDIPNNNENVVKNNEKDSVVVNNEINNKIDEKSLIKSGMDNTEPMFKKKTENALPTTRYTKNKHVIFPSENISLLTDAGNARYLKDGEINTADILQC
ncbi:hypothetical protein ACF0H5_001351 [Mactra antiquata]